MKQNLAKVALLVNEYDEAIDFYTQILEFKLIEDNPIEDKRWVVIAPPGSNNGCHILLARAKNAEQRQFVGNQTGGRVFLFLYTDDFWRDYRKMLARGVEFVRNPNEEAWGTVAVFKDLYGNLWDFIQTKSL